MPCYHPLKGFPIGLTVNGKIKYKITSYDCDHVEVNNKNQAICIRTADVTSFATKKVVRDFVQIPCGQCLGCRLDYSQQWATRCMLELPYHRSSYFVTLTYNDAHVPESYYSDPDTGEAHLSYTLRKRDFQLFMKRLRKRFSDQKIRFFAAGEYGSDTLRPHYHAILFGLELNDLVPYKKNALGQTLSNSESLQSCWRDKDGDIGYAVVADVTWESCAYVSRYIMKKQKGESADVYEDFALEPEFSLMSRKPGLAHDYFLDHPEIYDFDQINISTSKGGRKVKPPRYYDRLFDDIAPERLEEVKVNRKDVAEAITAAKMAQTSLSYLEMLAVEEANRKAKVKVLRRKEC